MAQPVEILHSQRPVHPQLVPELLNLFFGNRLEVPGGDVHEDRIARKETHDEEDHEADDEDD
jgi:hypothetical protein